MTLVTYQGIAFDYVNPTVDMINIKDIIYSLGRGNRFVGHSVRAYSIAEHSYLCYKLAKELGFSIREQLLVLIHDFTEAYVGDCPAPLKKLLPEFSSIEERIEKVIYKYVGIEPPTEEEYTKIKICDLAMLAIEMRDLTSHDYTKYTDDDLTEIVNWTKINLSSEPVEESLYREKLFNAYNELLNLGADSYTKYRITYGVEGRESVEVFEYHVDSEDALDNAFMYAKGLYYSNPNLDILEIMKEYGVDEETAITLFDYSMAKAINFHAEK